MKKLLLIILCAVLVNARWSINYGAREEASNSDLVLDWWEHGVFYQIYPRSFKDSDGDGIGDLRGIIDNLEHLKDLGVTAALLGPVFLSPMIDGGYDIIDHKIVDPIFGTNDDLIELFAKAKTLGLKILLDYVPNMTSDQHDWFSLSASGVAGFEDYYTWRNCALEVDGSRRYINNWVSVFHTRAWSYHPARDQCYMHHFTPQQPDLNFRNPNVYAEMLDVLQYWLEQGVDGFRIDAVRLFETSTLSSELHVNMTDDRELYANILHDHTVNRPESYAFIEAVRTLIEEFTANATEKHTRVIMTDTFTSTLSGIPQQIRWYGSSEEARGSHMPLNFAFISSIDQSSSAGAIKNHIDDIMDAQPNWSELNWVLGNHDSSRVGFRYGENRHESLAILTMMLPGPNVIYYGEEILMTDNREITFAESDDPQVRQTNESVFQQFTRDPARTPFQWDATASAGFSNTTGRTWLPVHRNYEDINLQAQKEDERSTYKLYQNLIKLRKENRVLQIGGYHSEALSQNVFAFFRTIAHHHTIAVFVNLGAATTTTNLHALLADEYSTQPRGRILITNNNSTLVVGRTFAYNEDIQLGAFDAIIFEVSSATKLAFSMVLLVSVLAKIIL